MPLGSFPTEEADLLLNVKSTKKPRKPKQRYYYAFCVKETAEETSIRGVVLNIHPLESILDYGQVMFFAEITKKQYEISKKKFAIKDNVK